MSPYLAALSDDITLCLGQYLTVSCTVTVLNGFRILAALLHGTLLVGISQTAALNRGRHLYSAGWPSRWALATFLVLCCSTFLLIVECVLLLC